MSTMKPEAVLNFWFDEANRKLWFNSTPERDRELARRFLDTWKAAREGRLEDWEQTAAGALALTIVLDQFPLNMFRGEALSFSTGEAARDVAQRAIERGFDNGLKTKERLFLYMPFMHSERMEDQERSVRLFANMEQRQRWWAEHHRNIIRRFGRFPHRNALLGRESTPEELAWLASPEGFR